MENLRDPATLRVESVIHWYGGEFTPAYHDGLDCTVQQSLDGRQCSISRTEFSHLATGGTGSGA